MDVEFSVVFLIAPIRRERAANCDSRAMDQKLAQKPGLFVLLFLATFAKKNNLGICSSLKTDLPTPQSQGF
jgi:hypothetical protein